MKMLPEILSVIYLSTVVRFPEKVSPSWLPSRQLLSHSRLIGGEERNRVDRHSDRIFTLTELVRMLTLAGLRVQAYYGGLDGSALTLNSRRFVVIGAKTK